MRVCVKDKVRLLQEFESLCEGVNEAFLTFMETSVLLCKRCITVTLKRLWRYRL